MTEYSVSGVGWGRGASLRAAYDARSRRAGIRMLVAAPAAVTLGFLALLRDVS